MPRGASLLVATTGSLLLLCARGVGAQAPRRAYSGGRGSGGGYSGGGYRRSASPARPQIGRGRGGRGREDGGYSRSASRGQYEAYDDDRLADGPTGRSFGGEYGDEAGDADPWDDEDGVTLPPFEQDDETDYIYGVSSVLTALSVGRRKPVRLLLQDSMVLSKRKDGALVTAAERLAAEAGVPVARVDKHRLNLITGNRPHQGIALQADKLRFAPLSAMPAAGAGRPVWLALDEVSDPQNLGSLLRSALFLGAAGVLVSEKNSAPLSPAVSRASAGAMELMTVHSTRNLVRTLAGAAESGWVVAGAALDDSVTVAEMDHAAPTILVLGSEGKGLRTSVLRECGLLVRVPRADSGACTVAPEHARLVDSLNVGVAGGVLLSAIIQAGAGRDRV